MKKSIFTVAILSLLMAGQAKADEVTNQKSVTPEQETLLSETEALADTTKAKEVTTAAQGGDRNVMMNAESSTSPRTINIGIPISGDIVIEENDIPVVYYFYPTIPTYVWRNDQGMGSMGLSTFGETAIRTGKVGLAVESSVRHASNKFRGYAQVKVDHFGSTMYNICLTGPLGGRKSGWGYMIDFYQNNEHANGTNYKFYSFKDRTTIVKGAIEKKYKDGNIRLIYKYSNSKMISTNYSPMIYEGDGKTKELDNFRIGRDAFIVGSGLVPYYDPNTGDPKQADLSSDEFLCAQAHTIQLNGEHRFKSGLLDKWRLTYTASFMHDNAPFAVNFPISLMAQMPDQQGDTKYKYFGTEKYVDDNDKGLYHGSIAWVMGQYIPNSNNNFWAGRAELHKKTKNNNWRLGLNLMHYHRHYKQYSAMYVTAVEPNPSILDMYQHISMYGRDMYVKTTNDVNGAMYPRVGGGYGNNNSDFFTKAALYASDEIHITPRWDLTLGARLELQNLREHKLLNGYKDVVDERTGQTSRVYQTWGEAETLNHNFGTNLNFAGTISTLYKVGRNWGVLADATILSWKDAYWDWSNRDANNNPAPDAQTGWYIQSDGKTNRSTVTNSGIGLYFNVGTKLQVVSKVLLTTKNSIRYTDATITNPANPNERTDCGPIFYDLKTLGWTTDIMANPFKGFNLHFLVTLQNPQYKNFDYSAYGVTYSYTNNTITSLSKFLMEIDPSYTFLNGKVRAWVSLRYFGKQYGNPTNAFYYNGWWESFGGVDLNFSRNFSLKLQCVNLFDTPGVKGDIQGANQITDATPYYGRIIMATGIRPRTFEATATFKF